MTPEASPATPPSAEPSAPLRRGLPYRFAAWTAWRAWRLTLWLVLAVLVLIVVVMVGFGVRARWLLPELRSWHTVELKEEFHADMPQEPATFEEYLRLEDRLFAELKARVYDDVAATSVAATSRYHPASRPARYALETPYNRSFELLPKDGKLRGGALLMHGLTDSPYSMRATAEVLQSQGFYVLVLRLPGHGTTPNGLLHCTTEDWKAAMQLGARHVASKLTPKQPFFVGGYSTGATLAVIYGLEAARDRAVGLRQADRLLLLSPAIGVTEFARLSDILATVSIIPALRKAEWLDVVPEYDPYKYGSMPLNGGKQVYRLTKELDRLMADARSHGGAVSLPEITSFQSIVDSTVLPARVASHLFRGLAPNGHTMVLFDINTAPPWYDVASASPRERIREALGKAPYNFHLLVYATPPDTGKLTAFSWRAETVEPVVTATDKSWPAGIVSLGHVSLPFRPDDPVYGISPAPHSTLPPWPLGQVPLRGEAGAISIPLATFTRLRSNPFWDIIEAKLAECVTRDVERIAK